MGRRRERNRVALVALEPSDAHEGRARIVGRGEDEAGEETGFGGVGIQAGRQPLALARRWTGMMHRGHILSVS
jgi:hypothetical protein